MPQLPARIGTYYRGGQGQWSWALHRITGIAVIFFLFIHILDTALVGFGAETYERVVNAYHNPVIRLMEIGLGAAVLFHALNGLRIILIDFFPRLADYHKVLFRFVVALYILMAAPMIYFMGLGVLKELGWR